MYGKDTLCQHSIYYIKNKSIRSQCPLTKIDMILGKFKVVNVFTRYRTLPTRPTNPKGLRGKKREKILYIT